MAKQRSDDSPRSGRVRLAGDIVGEVGGAAFRRFGFVQSAIVSRWKEIVGDRYGAISSPESIRFPTGRKSKGVLTLCVEGAHAPLLQHIAPMVIERVNRFFGYEAIDRIVFKQGRAPAAPPSPKRPEPATVPAELGEGLREIADPELRAVLESLAAKVAATTGAPSVGGGAIAIPVINRRKTT